MTRKVQNMIVEFGRSCGGNSFRPWIWPSQAVGQDQAAEVRDLDRVAASSRCAMSGQPNRISGTLSPGVFSQWPSIAAILAGWCSSVLRPCRSPTTIWIGATISSIHIAIENIVRTRGVVAAAQQVPGAGGAHEQRRRQVGRHRHVHEAIGEGRIEDDLQPVDRHDPAVDDLVALRGLHPAVRGEDPGRRDQRAERHHERGEEVQPRPDPVPAEQHDAEEAGLEEERGQHLIGQQRAGHAAGEGREAAPVGAELVGHDQAGDDAHGEIDREDLRPEMVEVAVDRVLLRSSHSPSSTAR